MIESPETLAAFTAMESGSRAKLVWDSLEDHLSTEQKRLDRAMFAEMAKGTLTPERAVQFCHEKWAHFKFVSSLEQKMRAASAAGAHLKPYLEGETSAE